MPDMADCGPECTETQRQIEAFLDGETEVVARVKIEQHLTGCNPCTDRVGFHQHLREVVRDKCHQDDVPDRVVERVRAAIRGVDPPA